MSYVNLVRRVDFTGDTCPKNTKKRYNVTILELNPVISRDDVDRCRRRESSISTGVNDVLQSSSESMRKISEQIIFPNICIVNQFY